MLGAIAVETVGKQHHKTIVHVPFGFARCDELVDHDLGAISKVTELSFPQSKRVR